MIIVLRGHRSGASLITPMMLTFYRRSAEISRQRASVFDLCPMAKAHQGRALGQLLPRSLTLPSSCAIDRPFHFQGSKDVTLDETFVRHPGDALDDEAEED